MGPAKRNAPPTFHQGPQERSKRYRQLLISGKTRGVVLDVEGTPVRIHYEVLAAESPNIVIVNSTVPVRGKRVFTVQLFVEFLNGVDVFEDGQLDIGLALELTQMFKEFGIMHAARLAAQYCVTKCSIRDIQSVCANLDADIAIQNALVTRLLTEEQKRETNANNVNVDKLRQLERERDAAVSEKNREVANLYRKVGKTDAELKRQVARVENYWKGWHESSRIAEMKTQRVKMLEAYVRKTDQELTMLKRRLMACKCEEGGGGGGGNTEGSGDTGDTNTATAGASSSGDRSNADETNEENKPTENVEQVQDASVVSEKKKTASGKEVKIEIADAVQMEMVKPWESYHDPKERLMHRIIQRAREMQSGPWLPVRPNTLVYFQIRALLEIENLTQKFVTEKMQFKSGILSSYMNKRLGKKQKDMEAELIKFIEGYVEGKYPK